MNNGNHRVITHVTLISNSSEIPLKSTTLEIVQVDVQKILAQTGNHTSEFSLGSKAVKKVNNAKLGGQLALPTCVCVASFLCFLRRSEIA